MPDALALLLGLLALAHGPELPAQRIRQPEDPEPDPVTSWQAYEDEE